MPEIIVPNGWRERLESLAGLRRDLWIPAAVVGVVVVGGFLLWARGSPASVAPPSTDDGSAVPAPPPDRAPAAVSPGPSSGAILVHVSGAVRRPGLYELPAGARIADAVELARGPRGAADLGALNLAEPLIDGQKVDVPKRGEAATATVQPPPSPAPGATPAALVNLNTADQAALETIPEVGPVTAAAILEYRDEIGRFESVEQLLDVTGIGPATLEAIRSYVTV